MCGTITMYTQSVGFATLNIIKKTTKWVAMQLGSFQWNQRVFESYTGWMVSFWRGGCYGAAYNIVPFRGRGREVEGGFTCGSLMWVLRGRRREDRCACKREHTLLHLYIEVAALYHPTHPGQHGGEAVVEPVLV